MAAKKSVLVGIAAIAVIGVAAVVYFSQWPPSGEDATGAIGAAERYRAEQITDEDVILDIPGQEQLAEEVFEILTDEQKAELLGRAVESERGVNFKRFEANEAAFERWSAKQKAGFVNALNRDAQADLAAAMKIDAGDFAAMRSEMVAEKFSGLDQEARSRAYDRFEANEAAFERWSAKQKAGFVNALNRDAQADLAAAMKIDAGDFAAMRSEMVAEKFSGLDQEARSRAYDRFEANEAAFERWSAKQKAGFVNALNRNAQADLAAAMKIDAGDFAAMRSEMVAEKFSGLDQEARSRAYDRFEANEAAFERWSAKQKAGFVNALNRDAQADLAAAMKIDAGDFAAMRSEMVAEKFSGLDQEARSRAYDRFEANEAAFERWSAKQKAGFVNALNRNAQADLAAAMKIDAGDFAAMRSEMVAEKFSGLDQEARSRAYDRFEANEAAFERWSVKQKAGFTNVLGAKMFDRTILQARTFNRLTHAQQRQVWSRLGSDGQFAALRYAGVDANLARGDALQRGDHFERIMQERRANE